MSQLQRQIAVLRTITNAKAGWTIFIKGNYQATAVDGYRIHTCHDFQTQGTGR